MNVSHQSGFFLASSPVSDTLFHPSSTLRKLFEGKKDNLLSGIVLLLVSFAWVRIRWLTLVISIFSYYGNLPSA